MRTTLWCFIVCISGQVFAQNNTLSGKVVDAATEEPVSLVNVFFGNTSIGDATDAHGNFVIDNIPPGRYELVASSVGYKPYSVSLDFSKNSLQRVTIRLEQTTFELPAIVTRADTAGWHRNFLIFKRYFLGETKNAKKCIIKNPQDIILYLDKDDHVLTAYARKPIVIENHALGYRISYLLERFEMDFENCRLINLGIPRFEKLTPMRRALAKKWDRERERAYGGSLIHFMRSLRQNKISGESFKIRRHYPLVAGRLPGALIAGDSLGNLITDTHSLFEDNTLRFSGTLHVIYQGEREEAKYRRMMNKRTGRQESLIHFNQQVEIESNGYFGDVRNIFLEGYLAWSEKISELLPLEYVPDNIKR